MMLRKKLNSKRLFLEMLSAINSPIRAVDKRQNWRRCLNSCALFKLQRQQTREYTYLVWRGSVSVVREMLHKTRGTRVLTMPVSHGDKQKQRESKVAKLINKLLISSSKITPVAVRRTRFSASTLSPT